MAFMPLLPNAGAGALIRLEERSVPAVVMRFRMLPL